MPMGTIWSSSPWMMSVGTSNFLRSSVKSVSEKALMQSNVALRLLLIPWRQYDSRTPSETFASDLRTSGPDHLGFDRRATSVGTLQGS
jgi:hypothetical protein